MQRTLIHPTMPTKLPNIKEAKLSKCGLYLWFETVDVINYETGAGIRIDHKPIKLADHEGLLEAWTKLTGA